MLFRSRLNADFNVTICFIKDPTLFNNTFTLLTVLQVNFLVDFQLMGNMVHGENSVNAPNLAPVEHKKEHVNVTALLQNTVEKLAPVHHQSQEVATLKYARVNV